MALESRDRKQIAQMGGLARSATAPSGAAVSAPARTAFWNSFYERTDAGLPEEERQRQATAARKLHMTRLSRLAAQKRQQAARTAAEAAEATAAELAAIRDIAV